VLFVLVNFRIGNTLIAASAAEAAARALPGCRVGFLGGPVAPVLLAAAPVTTFVFSREDRFRPGRWLALVRALRRERFEVAVHLGSSAAALGALLTGLSGAPQRIGVEGRGGNLFYTTVLPPPAARHKLAALDELLGALGLADASVHRHVSLRDDERARAAAWLAERMPAGAGAPVALFTGGRVRKGKAWTLEGLAALAERLRARGVPLLVVLGPEERAQWPAIRAALGGALYLEVPPLRELLALCSHCRAIVAPDSGPMHLAIASGAPVVALFRRDNHARWGPRARGEVVLDPEGREVDAVLAALDRAEAAPS
jgi:ADP-heptose:LPS heptosyltransferase